MVIGQVPAKADAFCIGNEMRVQFSPTADWSGSLTTFLTALRSSMVLTPSMYVHVKLKMWS